MDPTTNQNNQHASHIKAAKTNEYKQLAGQVIAAYSFKINNTRHVIAATNRNKPTGRVMAQRPIKINVHDMLCCKDQSK